MKKYMITNVEEFTVTVIENEYAINFPAEIGNVHYDLFLLQAQLTDEEVHALTPDVWYDFPEENN
jgi:hypothetical protein